LRASAKEINKAPWFSEAQRTDLRCYLKQRVDEVFPKALVPLGGIPPIPRWQKCAIVSSSGAMLKHQYGKDIDAAESVFRFNDAPVIGFESHVGSKETVRIGNSRAPVDMASRTMPANPGVSYLLHFDYDDALRKSMKAMLSHRFPQSNFYAIQDGLWGIAEKVMVDLYDSRWRTMGHPGFDTKVTTGAVGMFIAMSLCHTVEAYEMAPSDVAKYSRYNYYEKNNEHPGATDNSEHSTFESEHDLWGKLSSTSLHEISRTGRSVIPGFSAMDCKGNHSHAPYINLISESAAVNDQKVFSVKSYSIGVVSIGMALCILLPFAVAYAYSKWRGQVGIIFGGIGVVEGMGVVAISSLVIYVTLLIASDTLISYTAQAHGGHYPWNPAMVVVLVEGAKLIVSFSIYCYKASAVPYPLEISLASYMSLAAAAAVRLFPVAAIYAGNNCLVYIVLGQIELDSYVVWRNTTIFFNALLWTLILSRTLCKHQWAAIGFLMAGCCLNSLETNGSMRDIIGYPVLIVLTSAFMSALAAVLNEAMLKAARFQQLGIDGLNCLLYGQTTFMLLAWILGYAAFEGRPVRNELPHLASQMDRSAVAIVAMQVALGITVSRVLLYSNTVAKTMAGSAREIIQVGIAPLFVTSRLDAISLLSVLWIATAMLTYAAPSEPREDKCKMALARSVPNPEDTPECHAY
jgi:hypothetical protein